jgi:hypothetical protein
MDRVKLEEIASHLQLMADVEFGALPDGYGRGQVQVRVGGKDLVLEIRRDLKVAAVGDVEFIAKSLADFRQLLHALQSEKSVSNSFEREVAARVAGASPAPWYAFIEVDGGQGGCDVIRVSDRDDEADMYLWIGEELAPSDYFRFVAAARQDIPWLLDAVQAHE